MRIIIDYKLDNWNDTIKKCRTNYKYANEEKKKEMNIIRLFLLNTPKITKYPIKIACTWYVKNINSDLDNKSIKSLLDQMQKMGILENDNINHISEINYKAVKSNKDYLIVDIDSA